MLLYRIAKAAHAKDLSGTGARLYGGRWNRKGTAVLYTASNPALATVELLVHVDANLLPDGLRMIVIEAPDDGSSRTVEAQSLGRGWRAFPAPARLAEIGTRWVESGESLMLRVPSAVVEEDFNVLVNPAHPEFESVRVAEVKPYQFDKRLAKRAQPARRRRGKRE